MQTLGFLFALLVFPYSLLAGPPTGKSQQLSSPDQVPEGLAKSDWASIRAAYEAGRHAFQPVEGGWQARNPGQQWTTKFDRRGFLAQPRGGGWQWGLELRAYGFAGAEVEVKGVPAVQVDGQRLCYDWDEAVQEWFVNDQRGLEHGFTVKERPAEDAGALARLSSGSPLSFSLKTRGTLVPSITADGRGVIFRDAAGAAVLNYTGLKVWDADHKVLASHFAAAPEGVRLLVEERGARYPLTIDPIAQQAFLKAGETPQGTREGDFFGSSVAVSGDTVVVGAYGEDSSATGVNGLADELVEDAGAAYVFVRSEAGWSQQAYLKAGQVTRHDYFGTSVAISGDTVVVGVPVEDGSAAGVNGPVDELIADAGAAYVFVRSGTLWSQQAYLKATEATLGDRFGTSVAISGDTVVVGAPGETSTSQNGAAYLFARSGTTWSFPARLEAMRKSAGDHFGSSVAVSGGTVVVGAPHEDGSATGVNGVVNELASDAGAAYVFTLGGAGWSQQAYLKASQVTAGDNFGTSVAISGDTLVVGAWGEDGSATGVNGPVDELAIQSGAAYVFVRGGAMWSQQAYLKAGPTSPGDVRGADFFGLSVAVAGDTVVVGAYGEDSSIAGINSPADELALDSGAAYVFNRSGTVWTQQAWLKAGQVSANDRFGNSVAVSGDTVVVGAPFEDGRATGINSPVDEGSSAAGAVCVFERSGAAWSQQAYVKASEIPLSTPVGDQFGFSVAVSGDTVVVGAPNEDGSTAGVNGVVDEISSDAGAAYVFIRSGATWSQQAYLKAGQVSAGDRFGTSVAISGDTVIVGAPSESGSATGVNGVVDENEFGSGAAYVFVRIGITWSQLAYLKASNTEFADEFGTSVAVSGDTIVVGASMEDSSSVGVNSTPNQSAAWAGAAYVFVRSGITLSQQAYLKASQVTSSDFFGTSVAISGDTVVVGAPGEDSSTTGVNTAANESASRAGAAYVFVRSAGTWSQQAYLKATQVSANDAFGTSVAVSGDTVVVGAPDEDGSTNGVNGTVNESANAAGAAYVFFRSGITWLQQAYLKASHVTTGDNFGTSVAISGESVVVGAPREDSSAAGVNGPADEGATDAGAAYVFFRSGITWSQQAYLKAGQVSRDDRFGTSVAIAADTVLTGAPNEDGSAAGMNGPVDEAAADAGAANVFVRSAAVWSQQAYLKTGPGGQGSGAGDRFGSAVAVSGDTVVVGAPLEDGSAAGVNGLVDEAATNAGAAYVFFRSGSGWSQQAYLKAGQVSAGDQFGISVAIAGDTVVVGANTEDGSTAGINGTVNELAADAGAAWVFVRTGTVWSQQAYLKAAQVTAGDEFGASVAVSGDTVVVGATGEDGSATGVNGAVNELAADAGAAYVFVRSGGAWSQQAYVKSSQVTTLDRFGSSVAVSGGTVVVGAPLEDGGIAGVNGTVNETRSAAGAAWVFVRSGVAWSQQAYLKASQVTANDRFGNSVAVSGETIVVGARLEDGSTAGVNGAVNESATDSGAAYVFVRSGATWSQQAYLKASQVTAGDEFGTSVAISGDTVLAGAPLEDGSATGVNGAADEAAADAGAAYAFLRAGTVWTQHAYSKASQVTPGDGYGISVAVSGETVVAGALSEDSLATGVNGEANELSPNSGAAYIITLGAPDMVVTQAGPVPDGGSVDFGAVVAGGTGTTLTFTIANEGNGTLASLGGTKSGANPEAFVISAPSATSIPEGPGTATFTVTFSTPSSGSRTAVLHIASNMSGAKNPYDIILTGRGLSFTEDTDGDGLSDAAEFQMAALGLDWQVAQPALVATLFSNLGNAQTNVNAAGYYSPAQIQALNVGAQLIARNPATGEFKLTLGIQKSTDLQTFTPFPMTAPQTSITPAGKLDFLFTVPDNAAFFKVLTE